ncbi:hypothetical protein QP572_15135, partial [Brevibacterium sp. UMB10442]|nr:hypothetical protein [Brevibacterium sp. UMB10442]
MRLKRDNKGERILKPTVKAEYKGMTLKQIYEKIKAKGEYNAKYMDFVEYDFANAYEQDPQDTKNRPG